MYDRLHEMHLVGVSWVWDIASQLPMDITRLKDGLLRWVLSSLYKAHPERMIWFYGKLLDGFVADEYRMRHRNVRFFAECPNTVVIALIVAENDNDLANYGVYGKPGVDIRLHTWRLNIGCDRS
jgi:hypothetical protein